MSNTEQGIDYFHLKISPKGGREVLVDSFSVWLQCRTRREGGFACISDGGEGLTRLVYG